MTAKSAPVQLVTTLSTPVSWRVVSHGRSTDAPCSPYKASWPSGRPGVGAKPAQSSLLCLFADGRADASVMAHFYRDQQSPPYEIQSPHIMPLKYGEVPGEYEAQYRPDANTYHQDKKTSSYGVVQPVAVPQGDRPNYKPGPLRWPLLCALIIVLLGLIAATEWACHTLPVEDRQRPLPTTAVSSQPMATTTPTPTATPLLMARQESPQSEAQASTTAPPDSVSIVLEQANKPH
jgi:hypothetical protein